MARDWRLRILVPVAAVLALASAFSTGALAAGKAADDKAAGEQAEAGTQVAPATAKKKHDPAEAQRAVDAAAKLIDAGKTEQAVQALSATLAGGNLPPAIMARALLLRGIAYRQQKKPAQAIADFTSALWLKGGLSESDRADGLRQRTAAYQEAGLSQAGEIAPAGALAKEARPKERSASPAASAPWSDGTTTSSPPAPASALNQEQSAPAKAGGGWDLFANLFGGSGSAFAGQPAAAAASPPADAARILNAETSTAEGAPPARRAQASGWARQTQVEGERSPRVETGAIASKEEPPRRQAALPEAGKKSGHIRIQIAAVRTQAEAKALAAKVMREHAATLAAHEPQIDQTVMGNMGSFYRVLIGPFASAQETQGVCAKLKGAGLDCLVTAQ
ncbi:MAG TPA: SPOR domain-containing protein [Hyphomicrobiaceae bacterium]|nr:SPOR domain-containing protein [Hyphomicrobiaceae bacterium]